MAGSTELRLWRRKPSGSWGAVEQAEVEGEYGATVVRRGRVNQFMDKRYPSAPGCFGPDPRTPIRARGMSWPQQGLHCRTGLPGWLHTAQPVESSTHRSPRPYQSGMTCVDQGSSDRQGTAPVSGAVPRPAGGDPSCLVGVRMVQTGEHRDVAGSPRRHGRARHRAKRSEKAAVGECDDALVWQPPGNLQQPLPGTIDQRLEADTAPVDPALQRHQYGQERQRPDPLRPRYWYQQHRRQPAQPACLDEMAMARAHRIAVNAPCRDLRLRSELYRSPMRLEPNPRIPIPDSSFRKSVSKVLQKTALKN